MSTLKKARKASKNTSTVWECKHGCEIDRKPCKHLERLLPQEHDRKVPRISNITARSQNFFTTVFPTHDDASFKELLRNYGILEPHDVELLVMRYVNRMSIRAIAREEKYVDESTVRRRLKKLHALLVERGLEQELW